MTTSFTFVRNGSIALIAFVLLALPMAKIHAADIGDDGSYDFYPDTSSYDFYPDTSSYDFYPADTSSSYDFYPDQSNDNSYLPTSYMSGGSYLGSSYIPGPSYLPSRPVSSGSQVQTQSQAQVSNNTNTNVNNNVITINTPTQPTYTPPAPVYNYPTCTLTANNYNSNYNTTYPNGYNQPVTLSWYSQYATSGYISNGIGSVALSGSITVNPQYTTTYTGTFYGQNGQTVTCSATVNRNAPIVYANTATPYISLSQAPYTGLDLGFWGTIAYWGFLVLWVLVATYLVVVKKVQNRILGSLNRFLFGDYSAPVSQATATVAPVASAPAAQIYSAPVNQVDAIDPFILSQINRVRA